jgi:hypothetical protein
MNTQGIRTFIYPVKDIVQAKALNGKLLNIEPYQVPQAYLPRVLALVC